MARSVSSPTLAASQTLLLGDVPASDKASVRSFYKAVRQATTRLCEPLVAEDYILQSMADASPIRWHIAHTNWFFETFVLLPHLPAYQPFHPQFKFLFNSYYNAVGPRWPRPQRGVLSRPTVEEIIRYRAYVDTHMDKLLGQTMDDFPAELPDTLILGCHHEQQHQELMLTDLKHAWGMNPIDPVYRPDVPASDNPPRISWSSYAEKLAWIGHEGAGFSFDNESPRHRTFVHGFELANRLATNREYLAFMDDGGYSRSELWLSDGWNAVQSKGWKAPLYWDERDHGWTMYTLAGRRTVALDEPVCHLSYYEADAFARWAGARLPTEAEWETAAEATKVAGNFVEAGSFHPGAAPASEDVGPIFQLYGDVWQWTASPYVGYPGFKATIGALGEYNGKFMCNQLVLRGASCATPRSHARQTYRNFFPPEVRWQFAGLRLAKDLT